MRERGTSTTQRRHPRLDLAITRVLRRQLARRPRWMGQIVLVAGVDVVLEVTQGDLIGAARLLQVGPA